MTTRFGPIARWGIGPHKTSQAAGRLFPRSAPERRTKLQSTPGTHIMIVTENRGSQRNV